MNEGVRITIEEWAGDNKISISPEQIDELTFGIDIAYDMSLPQGYGAGQIQTKERREIEYLKSQIDLLQRYIASKGYCITLFDDKIETFKIVDMGGHYTSRHDMFR